MNKNFLSYLLVGALCLSACSSKDEDVVNNAVINPGTTTTPDTPIQETTTPTTNFPKAITAGFAENRNADASSKSAIEGSPETSFQYVFQKDDKVKLFHLEESATYTNSSDGGTSANFELDGASGPLSKRSLSKRSLSKSDAPEPFDGYVALMPAQDDAYLDYFFELLGFEIPEEQTAVENSYDPNAAVFVSVSNEAPDAFKFRSLNSFLMIANGSDVEFERIELFSSAFLGGVIDWNIAEDILNFYEPSTTITLNGPINTNSNYFIALAPCTMDFGYTLRGYCADGSEYEYKVEKTVEFKRNQIRGVKPKWEKIEPVLSKSLMHSTIPSDEATSITFGKKSEYSDVSLVDYADEAKLIGVYVSTTDPTVFYVLSEDDGEIMAPEDCANLFKDYSVIKTLNFDNFNTANVTSMSCMLEGCSGLTSLTFGDNFNTANVTNMDEMFYGCSALTRLELGDNFNTANVTLMDGMFEGCSALTSLGLGDNFNTANVTSMNEMFKGCSGLTTLTLGDNFNTANVTNMDKMFYGCSALTRLELGDNFNTANITNMYRMFYGCSALTKLTFGDNFNTANVTDMESMFHGCSGLTALTFGDNFNTANVTNMGYMFYGCSGLTTLTFGDNFNTAKVKNMQFMFDGCSGLTNLTFGDNFNTANVTNMGAMFEGCSGLTTLTLGDNFNTANVKDMNYMFEGCSGLTTLTLGDNFNTSSVEKMSLMFYSCLNLKAIYVTDKFTTGKVSDFYQMFYGCTSLVGGMGTKYNSSNTDVTYAKFDGGASNPGYFSVKGVNLSVDSENKVDVTRWK